jgi:hypothetical protein
MHDQKKTHEYKVASAHSFTCWFPDYSTDTMTLWWSTIDTAAQNDFHNIPKSDTTYVYTDESGPGVLKSRAPGRRGD